MSVNIGQAVVTAPMTNGEPFLINGKDGAGVYQNAKKPVILESLILQKTKKPQAEPAALKN